MLLSTSPFVAILAAGRATRFDGGTKLDASFRGIPLGAHALRLTAVGNWAGCAAIVARLDGPFALAAREAGISLVLNSQPDLGIAGSLRLAAVSAEAARAAALMVLLADMPFITTAHLARLMGEFESRAPCSMAATGYPDGRIGVPALFANTHFAELKALDGDVGARGLLDRHRSDLAIVAADKELLVDIDTRDQLARYEGA